MCTGPVLPESAHASTEKPATQPSRRRRRGKKVAFRPKETLILLDWDDTILPTSFLAEHGWTVDTPMPPDQQSLLAKYAEGALCLLGALEKLGRVVIVTNAEQGWVELTCQHFLPALLPRLECLELLSARSTYEPFGISSPVVWKEHAFARCLTWSSKVGFFSGSTVVVRNVLSIGDSFHERDALLLLSRGLVAAKQQVRCKSLKLLERPDVARLAMQHELLCATLPMLGQLDRPLDLFVTGVNMGEARAVRDLRFACGNGEPFLTA